jgi:hypothetical protein
MTIRNSEERILTLHPQAGKSGVNISREKYNAMRHAILKALEKNTLTFRELEQAVSAQLAGSFDGSISWYVTTVKLDLEARGEIERVPGSSPQQIRRVLLRG